MRLRIPRIDPRPPSFLQELGASLAREAVVTVVTELGATLREHLAARRDSRREQP